MSGFLKDFFNQYGVVIAWTILTFFAGYIGLAFKRVYNKYIDTKTKKDIVRTCVRAVEQLYRDIHGEDKYNEAARAAAEWLNQKGIMFTDLELKMLIEAAVLEFKRKAVDEGDENDPA